MDSQQTMVQSPWNSTFYKSDKLKSKKSLLNCVYSQSTDQT